MREYTRGIKSWPTLYPNTHGNITIVDSICLTDGDADFAETVIDAKQLERGKPPSWEVCVFDDGFGAFLAWGDVFADLARVKPTTGDEIEALLLAHGFTYNVKYPEKEVTP